MKIIGQSLCKRHSIHILIIVITADLAHILETMKEAYRQIRIAQIYAHRVDWMMSGDDSEETMQQRLMEDLMAFEEEFKDKDWTEE